MFAVETDKHNPNELTVAGGKLTGAAKQEKLQKQMANRLKNDQRILFSHPLVVFQSVGH
jgi:hypothetical protein